VKAVDELETERNQQRDEEEQEGRVARDFRAGGVDVGIDAVGDEQQDGRDNSPKDDTGQGVNGTAAGSIEPGKTATLLMRPLIRSKGPHICAGYVTGG
jgi:hypothetical protein